jgi:glycosyltransferase involved in cell wall biosynthesis
MARVDVIIPCYKYAHYLPKCVESVLTQEGVDVRALVINDASPDDTRAVADALARSDGRVEVIHHAVNLGHIATYNEGIDWLRGEYYLLLSADDLLTPGALARAAGLMDRHPDVGFVFGRAIKTRDPQGDPRVPSASPLSKVLTGARFLEICCRTGGNVVPTPTLVVRTDLQKRLGGYRADLPHSGDLEMCMRLAAHAPVGVLAADQAYYRVHDKNMHKEIYPDVVHVLEQQREVYRTLFEECGGRVPGRDRLRRLADGALGRYAAYAACKAFDRGDEAACAGLMEYARSRYPSVRRDSLWLRLSVKRLMGFAAWKAVRGVYRSFRRRGAQDPSPFVSSGLFPGV